jgi:hypothetical protein
MLINVFLVVTAVIVFAVLVKLWLRKTTFNSSRESWEDSPEVRQASAAIETLGNPRLQEMIRLIAVAQENYNLSWQAELIRELKAADASLRNPFVPVWDHESFRAYADAMKVVLEQGDRSLFNQARSLQMLKDTPGHLERLRKIRDTIGKTDQ